MCVWVGREVQKRSHSSWKSMGPTAVGNQCSNLGQKIKSITIKFKYITISSHKKKYKKMGAEVVTYVTDTNYGH